MIKQIQKFRNIAFMVIFVSVGLKAEMFEAGVDYEILPQVIRTADSSKIEINEVFHYGCVHCYNFERAMKPWVEDLEDDVDFQRTPAIWHPSLEPYARAYFVGRSFNVLDKTHVDLFEAIHVRKESIKSENDIEKIFSKHRVDGEKFSKAYNSFGVNSQVNQAKSRIKGYRTQGTPELVVNGKYRITTSMGKGFEGMLRIASFLIEKERQLKS